MLLDCRDLSTHAVRIADGIGVVVCNTMTKRRLSGGAYAQRRADCEQGAAVLGVSALRDVTPEMLAEYLKPSPPGKDNSSPAAVAPVKLGFTPPPPAADNQSRAVYKNE